jgi:hypothetical protein
MSIYIAAKAGYIIKAFASGSFAVRVGAFLFVTVNLPDIVAKSSFREAYTSSLIIGNIIVKICSRTIGIF